MSVQGKKREHKDFGLVVGLFEAVPVAFNPTREELEKLLNIPEIEKDPEYLKDDNGIQVMNLSVWLKEVKDGRLFNLRFYLKDEERTNKNKDKNQYINGVGITSWADDQANLPAWFNRGDVRKAKVGEGEMYEFVRRWLAVDSKDPDANIDMEWRKLMRGNVKPLSENIGSRYTIDDKGNPLTIIALATVRTADLPEGGTKDYQQVYNRAFLPGYAMKFFRNGGSKVPKEVTKFIETIEDPEYGPKEFFGLQLAELHDYKPEENIAASAETALSTDGPDL